MKQRHAPVEIYLYQKHKPPEGPFTEDHLRRRIREKSLMQSDLAWHEGRMEWEPLHKLITGVGPVFPPTPKTYSWTEDHFEMALFNTRFSVLLAVFGALVASVVLFIKGSVEIWSGIKEFWDILHKFAPSKSDDNQVILAFIPAIDNCLFATVLLMFSMGIYELFVSKIDPKNRQAFSRPDWLNIKDLDDLKTHISEVVVMILIIHFFEACFTIELKAPKDLMWSGLGIALIAGALFVTHRIIAHRANHKKHREEGTVASVPKHE